jgi:uncharacterized membrane protein HdeD (DUF308 family)
MTTLQSESKPASGNSVALSVLLIVFGVLAIALPIASSLGITVVIGWLLIFSGITQLVHAFQSENAGSVVWKLAVAVFYLAAGAYLVARPAIGVAGLTLALGIFLFAEGVSDLIAYFSMRKSRGSSWILLDGIVTLILSFMIWDRWPLSSGWVIGTLVGISMVMTGSTRLMMILAARKLAKQRSEIPWRERAA